MQIRQKLTIQFLVIVAVILFLFSLTVFLLSEKFRVQGFYERLKNKSTNTVNILLTVNEIDSALLLRIERQNPVSLPNEKIIVFNSNYQIIYSSDEDKLFNVTRDILDNISREEEIRFKQGVFEMLGFVQMVNSKKYFVVAGAQDIYGRKKIANLGIVLLSAFGVSLIILYFVGRIYAGRAMQPISKVINEVSSVSANRMDVRVDEGNAKDEIAQLARTFNNMLGRLEIAFKVQKDFISNASHELRTPLTSITGQLEVLLLHDRDSEEYKEMIKSVLEDMKRLNNLSNRLLLLAQASSEASEAVFQVVRIDEIVWQARKDILEQNNNYKVVVSFTDHFDEKKLHIRCNDQLIKSALINLIDNACKYSDDQIADIEIGTEDEFVVLTIANKGPGIYPDDLNQIFQPFHRGKNTEKIRGHGIGLSLVQKIIELHRGSIEIESSLNELTVVHVKLPVANF